MAMDTAKKAELEKKIVIGLLGLFGATLVVGPLKNMVRLGSAAPAAGHAVSIGQPAAPAAPAVIVPKTRQAVEQMMSIAVQEPPTAKGSVVKAGEPVYTAQALRDPMKSLLPHDPPKPVAQRPLAPAAAPAAAPGLPTLQVRGILWGDGQAQAIINDGVYRVGEFVGELEILAIDRNGVTVDFNGSPTVISSATTSLDRGKAASQQARWR